MCRLHIKPSIGKVKLSKLTPGQVQGFYQDELNSGLAPSSVRYMHATLHRALKQAHRWRLVRDPKFVQELLGHATIALTLDRYSHWIPSMGDQTATAMEAALSQRLVYTLVYKGSGL